MSVAGFPFRFFGLCAVDVWKLKSRKETQVNVVMEIGKLESTQDYYVETIGQVGSSSHLVIKEILIKFGKQIRGMNHVFFYLELVWKPSTRMNTSRSGEEQGCYAIYRETCSLKKVANVRTLFHNLWFDISTQIPKAT